jgi:hypothetical protein
MTLHEYEIRQDEARKAQTNKLLKGKLADNIRESQIKEQSWCSRLADSPPTGINPGRNDENIFVVSDMIEQYPSFFRVLYCSLDKQFIMVYTLLFCQLEFLWGKEGNSLLSLFFIYLLEVVLRSVRADYGRKNLCKKSYVDARFLI